jgi:hypothetical protein
VADLSPGRLDVFTFERSEEGIALRGDAVAVAPSRGTPPSILPIQEIRDPEIQRIAIDTLAAVAGDPAWPGVRGVVVGTIREGIEASVVVRELRRVFNLWQTGNVQRPIAYLREILAKDHGATRVPSAAPGSGAGSRVAPDLPGRGPLAEEVIRVVAAAREARDMRLGGDDEFRRKEDRANNASQLPS